MASTEKQDIITTSGFLETPILASASVPMEDLLKPSPQITSIASLSSFKDKPISPAEALSLLQTRCFDLRSLGLRVAVLADTGELFIAVKYEGHALDFNGHILLDGQPVVKG